MTAPRALAHNKFMVIADPSGNPLSMWTGSTNWTMTGLCTQANNALYSEDPADARIYKDQWDKLSEQGDETSPDRRKANETPHVNGDHEIWFSPMGEQMDLKSCNELIKGAKDGVLFTFFNPGPRNSLLNTIIDLTDSTNKETYRPDLFIEGVVNQNPGTKQNPVRLFKRDMKLDPSADVVLPAAITGHQKYWEPELLKLPTAHAMVHSKVIVIDPFSDNPIVITGSHNLGPKASGTNDENMFIVHRNNVIAQYYALKVQQIYKEYKFRHDQSVAKDGEEWKGLADNDAWQIRDPSNERDSERLRELAFWMGKPGFVVTTQKAA
jgi:phosphatidylserine/phosphatidylglycerophosphate/cardiolipin synthase-like enzyme